MPTPTFPDLCVLVADESAHMRRLLRDMLSRVRIRRVIECSDGSAAITALAEGAPDVVVLDWDLPGLGGEEFIRLTRTTKTSPVPTVPIILMLSDPRPVTVDLAVSLGVNEIIVKPFAARTFWARLEEVVRRPRPFVRSGDLALPQPRGAAAAAVPI